MPFFLSQAGWEELRTGFSTQPGDIFSTGYLSSGNIVGSAPVIDADLITDVRNCQ